MRRDQTNGKSSLKMTPRTGFRFPGMSSESFCSATSWLQPCSRVYLAGFQDHNGICRTSSGPYASSISNVTAPSEAASGAAAFDVFSRRYSAWLLNIVPLHVCTSRNHLEQGSILVIYWESGNPSLASLVPEEGGTMLFTVWG